MLKLQFKDNTSRSLWLAGEKLTLGSDADNDIMLNGLGIEAFHATLEIQESGIRLVSEAGSCFVNDMPVDAEHAMAAGDELRIGQHRMLILTAQQADELKKDANQSSASSSAAGTGWSLQAEHSKLKDQAYPIAEKSVLGRSKDCDLAVPYKLLSRHHVELTVRGGQLHLQDLGSSNGSFVNGQRATHIRLKNGDKVSFAKLVFTVKGPVVEAELNKTMIRPAINIEAELKKSTERAPAQSLVPDNVNEQQEAEAEAVARSGKLWLFACLGLGLLAAATAYWLLAP